MRRSKRTFPNSAGHFDIEERYRVNLTVARKLRSPIQTPALPSSSRWPSARKFIGFVGMGSLGLLGLALGWMAMGFEPRGLPGGFAEELESGSPSQEREELPHLERVERDVAAA